MSENTEKVLNEKLEAIATMLDLFRESLTKEFEKIEEDVKRTKTLMEGMFISSRKMLILINESRAHIETAEFKTKRENQ
jgi:hypothetical protein